MKAKIVLFTEEVRTELANYFLEYEDYYIADSIPVRNLQVIEELKSVKEFCTSKNTRFLTVYQPLENALVSDREKYPLLPTSVYGNKKVLGYEEAMRTILPERL